jgi:hypothetical protein
MPLSRNVRHHATLINALCLLLCGVGHDRSNSCTTSLHNGDLPKGRHAGLTARDGIHEIDDALRLASLIMRESIYERAGMSCPFNIARRRYLISSNKQSHAVLYLQVLKHLSMPLSHTIWNARASCAMLAPHRPAEL